MSAIPYVVAYLAMGVFLAAVVAKIFMWIKLPMHLRWELYPVAHEAKRAHYGGSYLEESEWWKKPREASLLGELKVMVPEILFLVALREHNPKLWIRSFPFHFGLYLVIACTVLMAGSGLFAAIFPAILQGGFSTMIHYSILASGVCGLCLSLLGALGLLQRRLTLHELKDYSSSADVVNLLFFIMVFASAMVTFFAVDTDFSKISYFVGNLVTFRMSSLPGSGLAVALPTLSVVLMSLLLAYIPLTHMSHFIGKYFSYHAIRWNDKPNLQGGDQESTIEALLSQPVTWSAAHIKADGKKNWAEIATDIATEENKK